MIPSRASRDLDLLVDLRVAPRAPRRFIDILAAIGVESTGMSTTGTAHRYTLGTGPTAVVVDDIAPDGFGPAHRSRDHAAGPDQPDARQHPRTGARPADAGDLRRPNRTHPTGPTCSAPSSPKPQRLPTTTTPIAPTATWPSCAHSSRTRSASPTNAPRRTANDSVAPTVCRTIGTRPGARSNPTRARSLDVRRSRSTLPGVTATHRVPSQDRRDEWGSPQPLRLRPRLASADTVKRVPRR
jgi:hypothetical protein